MNKTDALRFLKKIAAAAPKILFLYVLAPCVLLLLLAEPIRSAALRSDLAACLLPFAALAAVGLNGAVYARLHRKAPPLLVPAWGMLWPLIVVILEYEAFPPVYPLTSTLAVIGGVFALAALFLLSFWLAARRAKAAHTAAVALWVILFVIFCAMCYQVIRDIETRAAGPDTWISLGTLVLMLLAACCPWILSACRRSASRRRKVGLAEGTIVQIIGETRLDRDDDPVTRNHALIRYAVCGVPCESRADISRFTTRRFGKDAFIGKKVPVHYDPADPADAYADRITRHIFDGDKPKGRKAPPEQET